MIRIPRALLLLVLATALTQLPASSGPSGREPEREPSDDAWFLLQRALPDGSVPTERLDAAAEQMQLERTLAQGQFHATSTAMDWVSMGPANIGGQVAALAVVPGGNTIYLGSANGGVFKSVNAGVNWTPVSDRSSFFSIGALAINPLNANTVWCGTGEANSSNDSYDGNGLWRSKDAGASWHYVALASTRRISAVVVSPADSNLVFVGAMGAQFSTGPDRGFYRSTNNGQTWTKTLFVNDSTGVGDIVVNPVHPETVFCATWERIRRLTYRRAFGPGCAVWRSVDSGVTWTRLAGGFPGPSDNIGRIALAIAPSQPSTIYAQVISGAISGYVGLGLYRSVDAGNTWTKRDVGGSSYKNSFGGFGWFFGEMAVHPTDPNAIWTCGQTLLQSGDGGQTFFSASGNTHPDQHAIWVDPANPQHVYLGNDGGFWWTTGAAVWTKSDDLPISQFYAGDVDDANANKMVGGLQDNANVRYEIPLDGWSQYWVLADGFYNLIDYTNTNVLFAEWQNCSDRNGIYRSTNNGGAMTRATGFSTSDRYNWCTPMVMSPRNHNILLVGSQRVYRSTNNGISFSAISSDLTTNPVGALVTYGTITTLAISKADTSLYLAGTDDGKVWRSQNRGGTWEDISSGLPGRYVTRVAPDPSNDQVVYVTLSGFGMDDHSPHVFRSANRGSSWTAIEGNLPDAPANDLIVDPVDPATLYLGTDLGVFITRNLGQTWWALGATMPLQPVFDLDLHEATRQLYAFTHGRSVWKFDLGALPLAVAPSHATPGLTLSVPWPNPSNGTVSLALQLQSRAQVDAAVFDPLGRRVRTLAHGEFEAGRRELDWNGKDEHGVTLAMGVYFVRATAGGATRTQRVVRAR